MSFMNKLNIVIVVKSLWYELNNTLQTVWLQEINQLGRGEGTPLHVALHHITLSMRYFNKSPPFQCVSCEKCTEYHLTVCSVSLPIMQWCRKGQCVMFGDHGPKAVHGQWSGWSDWSDCSRSCGGGVMYRERSCSSPR